MTTLTIGQKAPSFSGKNQNEEIISLADFKGQKLVLFFYPKDDTPGCTAEACSLRDSFATLRDNGFNLLGVSPDKPQKHQKFIEKYQLPFDLIADEQLALLHAYQVWGPKKFMGKEYDGVHRTTFVIDESGIIQQIISKVDTKDHASQILATIS